MDKQSLMTKLESSHADWIALLEAIPNEKLTVSGVAGEWSVKDIIAHIAWYEWWLAEFITTKTWPRLPEHLSSADTDERNNAYYQDQKEVPLETTLSNEWASHQALVEAVKGLSDAEYADQTLLGMPTGPGWSLAELIPASTIDHYRDHSRTIREWLATQANA